MATKLDKVRIHSKNSQLTESCDCLVTWSGEDVTNEITSYLIPCKAYGYQT